MSRSHWRGALPPLIFCLIAQLGHAQMWRSIGPTPIVNGETGRVTAVAVDPSDSTHWLIGAATGGIWESHDSGKDWTPRTDGQPTLSSGAIAFAIGVPQKPQITSGTRSPADGATYIAGGLVPGSWTQVQGTSLSNVTRIWNDSDFVGLGNNLPTKLSGVEVKVNGVSASVYLVSSTQVSFQVPSGILSGSAGNILVSSPVSVQLFRDGLSS